MKISTISNRFIAAGSISTALFTLLLAAGPVLAQESTQPSKLAASTQLMAQASDAEAIAQEFVALMNDGNYQAALQKYDLTLRADLSVATLQQGWQDVQAASGSFQNIVKVETKTLQGSAGDSLAIVTCQFEKGSRDFFVVLTGSNQIASISLAEG